MLPIVLVIDDIYPRKELLKQSFLTKTHTVEISLEDLEKGDLAELSPEDDKIAYAVFCSGQLDKTGYAVNEYKVIREAVAAAWGDKMKYQWSLVLLDIMFDSGKIVNESPTGGHDGDKEFGLKVRELLLKDFPELPAMMLTSLSENEIEIADTPYLSKQSLDELRLKLILHGNLAVSQARKLLQIDENIFLSSMDFVRNTYYLAYKAATAKSTAKPNVLLLGETGTGKEEIAKYIHKISDRRDKPFVAINVAAFPETLIEGELFGIAPKSVTGTDPKSGKFEDANKGTLFLDEIGRMPAATQDKVLRALQERQVCKIGSSKPVNLDIQLLSSTSKNIMLLIEEDKFSEDLYHRINTIEINMPPLRENPKAIVPIATKLLNQFTSVFDKSGIIFADAAKNELTHHEFKGNIRELRNLMENIAIFKSSNEVISGSDIKKRLYGNGDKKKHATVSVRDDFNPEELHSKIMRHQTKRAESDNLFQADIVRIRELEKQIADLEAKLSAKNSFEDLNAILESISIPNTQDGLNGLLPKLSEAISYFLQKVLRNALLATKDFNGKVYPNTAVKLLMNKEITASQAYDLIKKICKLLNKEPNVSDQLVQEVLGRGIKNRPSNKKKKSI